MDGGIVVGIFVVLLFGICLALGVPLFISLMLPSLVGFVLIGGWGLATKNMVTIVGTFLSNYTLTVIPVFIFMGSLGHHSGILEDVFKVAKIWFGRVKGGIALSTVVANAVFAACSGSSIAAVLVIGNEALPLMRKSQYPTALATGVVAASGTLAALIPPSILLCIYALMVDSSVAKLLIAGIIPGIVSALIYMIYIFVRCLRLPIETEKFSWMEKIGAVRHLWVVVVLVGLIMYCMYTGWATPTEIGAVGACAIFLLALILGRMSMKVFMSAVVESAYVTGQILVVVAAAVFFSRFLLFCGMSSIVCDLFLGLEMPRLVIFILVVILYLCLGCFMGAVGMLAVSLPIIYPLMMSLGYDPIWFGIIVVIFSETALISPPIGMNVYAVRSIANDVPLTTIFRGSVGFMCMDVITVGVLYLFPQLVTFLPNLM